MYEIAFVVRFESDLYYSKTYTSNPVFFQSSQSKFSQKYYEIYMTGHIAPLSYSPTSGRPAALVSRDSIPASSALESTIVQLTSPNTAAVPIEAAAVCATVLSALTLAARIHVLSLSMSNLSFQIFNSVFRNLFPVLQNRKIALQLCRANL